jgi:hypothetical protein
VRGRALIALAQTGEFAEQSVVADLFDAAPHAAKPDIVASVQLAEADWSETFLSTLSGDDSVLGEVRELVTNEPLRTVL